jgi:ABC-2 type transport system permease protein
MAKVALRAMFLTGLAVGLPLLGVVVGGADLAAEGAGLRLALWIGVTAAYGAFWFALAVAVNALGRSSATNAMVLAGWWLMFVVAIPAVLNVEVKAMYPVPSRVELIQAMRVAGEDATRKGSQLLARYMEDHPELAPAEKHGGGGADFGTLLMAVNDETERTVQPVLERFEQQVAGQQAMVDRWRYVSPAIAVQAALSDLAGSSGHRHRHFLKQADVFHAAWRAFLYPKIVRKEKLTVGDIDKLPAFVYREEETGEMAKRLMAILAGLLVPVLLVGWPGLVGMRRYPVAG